MGASGLRYGNSAEGLHNPAVIEARRRFTSDALSVDAGTALDAGMRLG
jgi:hypothetical protein